MELVGSCLPLSTPVEVRSLLVSSDSCDALQLPVTAAEHQLGLVHQPCELKQPEWVMKTARTDLHMLLPSALRMCMPDLYTDQASSGRLTWLVW